MNDVRNMLIDSATRLFADHVDARAMEAAKRDGWSPRLWDAIEQAELARISIPEAAGGAGGTLSDLAAILRIAGRYTAPVPLAETALLANWATAECGLRVEPGACAVAHANSLTAVTRSSDILVSGTLERVAWARTAKRLVALALLDGSPLLVVIASEACKFEPGSNLAREPRDRVLLHGVPAIAHAPAAPSVTARSLLWRGALGRSLLTAGALERALELAVEYAQSRVQFGRKIGQFQAIQQELARAAGEVAAAVAAALSAAGALEREEAFLPIASAKIRTAEAAREVALVAHQIHGAMGVTDEYALHHATLRLWSWREEYGNEAHWAIELGRAVQRDGASVFWRSLAS